jgi:hypothetical protein
MEHRDIISEVANGLDLTNERGTEQHSAEQLVVRLDYAIAPLRACSVEGDIVTVGCEAGTIRLRVTVGPCLADPLEQSSELLVVDSLDVGISGGLIIGHTSMLDRKRRQGTLGKADSLPFWQASPASALERASQAEAAVSRGLGWSSPSAELVLGVEASDAGVELGSLLRVDPSGR